MTTLKNIHQPVKASSEVLNKKYSSSVSNILLVLAFTLLNIILLFTNSYTYFLFSAYVPYAITDLAMYVCGRYPAEVYGEEYANMLFYGDGIFVGAVIIAAVILALYLFSWIFARKGKVGWLVFALVFFSLDFLAYLSLNGFSAEGIVDIIFHVWVIVSLAMGIKAHADLKKLPATEQNEEAQTDLNGASVTLNGEAVSLNDDNNQN